MGTIAISIIRVKGKLHFPKFWSLFERTNGYLSYQQTSGVSLKSVLSEKSLIFIPKVLRTSVKHSFRFWGFSNKQNQNAYVWWCRHSVIRNMTTKAMLGWPAMITHSIYLFILSYRDLWISNSAGSATTPDAFLECEIINLSSAAVCGWIYKPFTIISKQEMEN